MLDRLRARGSKWRELVSEKMRLARMELIAGECETPPTDLNRLAKRLGIVKVREVDLGMRGRLLQEKQGLVVEINTELEPFEKRRVFAHELGHLLVERRAIKQSALFDKGRFGYGSSYATVEKLCDKVAQEILIPLAWLRNRLANSRQCLHVVEAVAEETQCSPYYVATRIVEESLWGSCFLLWYVAGKKPQLKAAIPPSAGDPFEAGLANPEYALTMLRSLAEHRLIRGDLFISFEEGVITKKVEYSPSGPQSVLMMIHEHAR